MTNGIDVRDKLIESIALEPKEPHAYMNLFKYYMGQAKPERREALTYVNKGLELCCDARPLDIMYQWRSDLIQPYVGLEFNSLQQFE